MVLIGTENKCFVVVVVVVVVCLLLKITEKERIRNVYVKSIYILGVHSKGQRCPDSIVTDCSNKSRLMPE